MWTYRNFFSHILLKFPQGLAESAVGLALNEGYVKGSDDVIQVSARRQWSHEGTRTTELSPAVASLDPEASGGGFGLWSSVIANSQRLEST
jgi:hypothetical protein